MSSYSIVEMLSKGIKDAKSSDPVKVAFELEGMKVNSLNGEVEMRKTGTTSCSSRSSSSHLDQGRRQDGEIRSGKYRLRLEDRSEN